MIRRREGVYLKLLFGSNYKLYWYNSNEYTTIVNLT